MEVNGNFFDPAALPPGKDPSCAVNKRLGRPPDPAWTFWRRNKFVLQPGIEPLIVQTIDLSPNWLKMLKEAIRNWLGTLRQYLSLRSEEKQNNLHSCWDLNRDVQEYEAGVPPYPPQSSVLGCHSTVSDTHLKMEKNINSRNVVY